MIPLTEQYERRALGAVDKVFALSEYTRGMVEPIPGREKVVLAACGIDTKLFRPAAKPECSYILCVARFSDSRKNVRLLLNAYSHLNQKMPDIPELYLIGNPPTEDTQLHLKQLGLATKVRLIGPKRGEELAELYRNAAFFVLSSDEEGLGIVILEAMASGLAVVSTNCGGPATAISKGQSGLLTPIGDTNAFVDAIGTLLSDPALRDRMGREGRRIAEEQFSLDVTGKIFLDTYDQVLNVGLKADREHVSPEVVPEACH